MRDFVGNELKLGDKVVYISHSRTSSHFIEGVVKGFTPKMVCIHSMYGLVSKSPSKVVKYMKD